MCAPIVTSKNWVQRFKHTTQKLPDMLPLRPHIWYNFFFQKTEVSSSNFQFTCRAKFSRFHLGRILHFSQKVVEWLQISFFHRQISNKQPSVMWRISWQLTGKTQQTIHLNTIKQKGGSHVWWRPKSTRVCRYQSVPGFTTYISKHSFTGNM